MARHIEPRQGGLRRLPCLAHRTCRRLRSDYGRSGRHPGVEACQDRPCDDDDRRTIMTSASVRSDSGIEPFHVDIPAEMLEDLRRRLAETRWPEKELVGDASQGVQLATMQALIRYWASEHDWRKTEAKLN